MSRHRGRQQPKIKTVRRPAKTASSKKKGDQLAQAKVVYADGSDVLFVSRDGGQTFYEHCFPDPKARFSPLKYSREWLKAVACGWDGIKSIEFMEGMTMTMKASESIHQATVVYSGGKTGKFFSRDSEWFYEPE
jgi:hypothetical protein